MRVCTYSRVSTKAQESEGDSLENQEKAFQRYLERTGAIRIHAYREAASAGTVEGRAEFSRMLAELPDTKPDAIIIDTLDRFTRNLREGLNLIEELRGHRVGLLPLDWRRDRPLDIDDDRDWRDIVDEFTSAEGERRKIRRRINRAYDEMREAGKTLANRPAFGVLITPDRQVIPDPETAWIVKELDARFMAGESFKTLLPYIGSLHARAWKTYTGLNLALKNPQYVRAGIRTPEMQAAINARHAATKDRFGHRRKHEHEFTGVFACGLCADLGIEAVMHGIYFRPDPRTRHTVGDFALSCHRNTMVNPPHPQVVIRVTKVEGAWHRFLAEIEKPEWLEWWAAGEKDEDTQKHRALQRRLSDLETQAARLKDRRDAALDLYSSIGVRAQAEASLREVGAEEATLAVQREVVLAELAVVPQKRRDAAAVRAIMANVRELYAKMDAADRNAVNRALVAAIGSRPVVRREGRTAKAVVTVSWPEVETKTPVELPTSVFDPSVSGGAVTPEG